MAEDDKRPVNDRNEGILRDPVKHQPTGDIVSYVKDVGNGDPGYDANVRKVVIMKQDGSEHVVPETEILRERRQAPQQGTEIDRRPDATLPPANLGEGAMKDNPQARPSADADPRGIPEANRRASEDAADAAKRNQQQQRAGVNAQPAGTGGGNVNK